MLGQDRAFERLKQRQMGFTAGKARWCLTSALICPTSFTRFADGKIMGQVDSKIAVVTGGASGIGAACAETLAREGAKVVLTDIDDGRGQELAAGIRSAGREAQYLSLDVRTQGGVAREVSIIEPRFRARSPFRPKLAVWAIPRSLW
jgi:short chain dehydrogenase